MSAQVSVSRTKKSGSRAHCETKTSMYSGLGKVPAASAALSRTD
ncbi:hypothetical protein [Candidatus Planktophila sulfonica]|nr:hypothetical protein [Candidatus Planktophila sulfonica]